MASHAFLVIVFLMLIRMSNSTPSPSSSLSPSYYDRICPAALPTIRRVVRAAVRRERRMGASLLRLHFHDCFVNGCDGSVLLDPSLAFDGEKNAIPNVGSLRGFEVVDAIKAEVDRICRKPVVSCADILAVAARDSVVALGGPSWRVLLGRRDATTASSAATTALPPPFLSLSALIANFARQGLSVVDLVALSGGHTIGFSRCQNFRNRIYTETNINPIFAQRAQQTCPLTEGNENLAGFDPTAFVFDTKYFTSLVNKEGLLHSDQELFNGGGETDALVQKYSKNPRAFARDFAQSMINMGNIKPLTGSNGQIRVDCRKVNA
ncbi:peroxidase [Lithospermum erythrorhizon]|uniref:Peroxidase n=1 Tax=Lithospermum erythrorhizon TaxID=34254 RepID=A0AAV3PBB1_LITER